MPNLEKIRFLTVNYSRLQGLKAIPSGMLLFLVVLWTNGQKGSASFYTDASIGIIAGRTGGSNRRGGSFGRM
jgi:hypothetical protein